METPNQKKLRLIEQHMEITIKLINQLRRDLRRDERKRLPVAVKVTQEAFGKEN